jgi:hypothetical protein
MASHASFLWSFVGDQNITAEGGSFQDPFHGWATDKKKANSVRTKGCNVHSPSGQLCK